jgi:hypothetical protein
MNLSGSCIERMVAVAWAAVFDAVTEDNSREHCDHQAYVPTCHHASPKVRLAEGPAEAGHHVRVTTSDWSCEVAAI